MNGNLDVHGWRDALTGSFTELVDASARYLPLIAGALVVLLVGWIVSSLGGWLTKRVLRYAGLDRGAARVRLTDVMRQAGVARPPSEILGQVVFFVLMLTFARVAMQSLGLTVVTSAIDGLVALIPKVIAGALIVLFGMLFGRLAAHLVTSGAATARVPEAHRLGGITYGAFVLIAGVMALERLGVETRIVVYTVTAAVAAVALTIGAGFALGARPLITHILAGHFLRQSLPGESVVEVRGRRGVIERVGPVDTVIRGDDQVWSIANGQLLDEVIGR